ncbi:phosphohexomutase domain-containing protein [Dongshaea marina]|uniref:phosphomannomutase CpsG n=1 Tax=Dongshaea marina TaxID=2047966 RepID=UPI000D3E4578|nr:phosphomannomutase CpsG [Dongshaea marina]
MAKPLHCFNPNDIRGRLGDELNPELAYRIGVAYTNTIRPSRVVVGGDARLSSEPLKMALTRGLLDQGVDVLDIGLSGSEEIYFATSHLGLDGGIEITASHNPIEYNGMKLVREGARPISRNSGLLKIQHWAELDNPPPANQKKRGHYQKISVIDEYIQKLLSFIQPQNLRPLKLVINSGNGAAGHVIDALERAFKRLNVPVHFIKLNHHPDGHFPNGIPNPLLVENQLETAQAVRTHRADMGVAFDGDFDRCFLFDEKGEFIEGYYLVGLLAELFLERHPGSTIIHDPRLIWNTQDVAHRCGGKAVMSRTGHAFIKEKMRQENAIYGGEMSAHHYFRDFYYCDSGMIPWLMIAELISLRRQPLSELLSRQITSYPVSGEINQRLHDSRAAMENIIKNYQPQALSLKQTDGITAEFSDWRFNLRVSNTEPLVRLNVETRSDPALLKHKTREIMELLEQSEIQAVV